MIGKPSGIAINTAGNIYIADADNNRIRRVEASTGIITTIAGTGGSTDSGDGGPATHGGVSRPSGVAIDSAGNVYFGSGWAWVRKVTADTGAISTVAGKFGTSFSGDKGPAIDAHFWDPVPGAVDGSGDIFIADFENSRIRKMAAATGIVDTVAGSAPCASGPLGVLVCRGEYAGDGGPATSARLNYASAVAADIDGNLYIADTLNHRIRRVDASTGMIRTIAGVGVSGFSGDGGAALAAEITTPAAIAVDYAGKVYFADEGNGRIRVLTPVAPKTVCFSKNSATVDAAPLTDSPGTERSIMADIGTVTGSPASTVCRRCVQVEGERGYRLREFCALRSIGASLFCNCTTTSPALVNRPTSV